MSMPFVVQIRSGGEVRYLARHGAPAPHHHALRAWSSKHLTPATAQWLAAFAKGEPAP